MTADVEPLRYWAFLSYSHADARWGTWLHRALESYRPPKRLIGQVTERGAVPRQLSPIFRDREELASATDLGEVINQALKNSACQIVICSPRAAQSRWVNEEILAFKRLGRENRIFCLIVDGEPNASDHPGQESQECFPPALRFRLGSDGTLSTERTEPIAADARPGKDGRTNAKLKLIAGVLGVGFDALKQREQQRRNRQMAFIAAAALAGMVVTSTLATVALIARATAVRQTARAEAEAETARQTTGFLVDVFRISDPSEARGNSITAREMVDKGAQRIGTELAKQPAIQSTLMDTLGTVYVGLGLYGQARPLLESAVATRRALTDSPAMALPESLNHLGDVLTVQADYERAEKNYREAITLLSSRDQDMHTQTVLAKSLYGLGNVQAEQGRYEEAERSLRDALQRQRQLFGASHGDIAQTLKLLAKVVDVRGDRKSAISLMQEAVTMQRALRGAQPHPDLAEAINDLGVLQQENGDYDAAEALYTEAIEVKRRLFGAKHPEIAMGLNNLATVFHDKGDLARAEATYRQALAMQRELLGEVHPDVANTLNNLAFVQDDRGDLKGALETERQSLSVYQQLFPGDHPEVARIMNRIGYWLTGTKDYAGADIYLRKALDMRRRLLGEKHPDVASSLTHLAILQVATGHYDDALASARSAVEICTASLPPAHWRTAVAESAEGAALAGLRDYARANELLERSYGILSTDEGATPTYRALTQRYLDQLHHQWRGPAIEATLTSATQAIDDGPAQH
jgi:tetratricopeptide (TPR) repeat protein